MRNIDGLIPQLCALAREHGEEKKRLPIRAAALQALAALVYFFTYLMECSAFLEQLFVFDITIGFSSRFGRDCHVR